MFNYSKTYYYTIIFDIKMSENACHDMIDHVTILKLIEHKENSNSQPFLIEMYNLALKQYQIARYKECEMLGIECNFPDDLRNVKL